MARKKRLPVLQHGMKQLGALLMGNTTTYRTEADAKTDCSYCHAPCCSLLVTLTPQEAHKYEHTMLDMGNGKREPVLNRRADGFCVYSQPNGRCGIYDNRPWVCVHYSCRTDARMTSHLKYGSPEE